MDYRKTKVSCSARNVTRQQARDSLMRSSKFKGAELLDLQRQGDKWVATLFAPKTADAELGGGQGAVPAGAGDGGRSVTIGPGGVHAGPTWALDRIQSKVPGLLINGQPWTAGAFGPEHEGQTVTVSHPKSKFADLAAQVLESATDTPVRQFEQAIKDRKRQQGGGGPVASVTAGDNPFSNDDDDDDDTPPKKDEASDDSAPPSEDAPGEGGPEEPKAEKPAGELHELISLVHQIADKLGIGPEPMAPGAEDGPAPDGPMPPLDGPPGPSHGPQEIIHKTKMRPGDTAPGVTPLGAPAFSSVNGERVDLSRLASFDASAPDDGVTIKQARAELEALYGPYGFKVRQIKRTQGKIAAKLARR